MPEAYQLGYEAAMQHKEELMRYSVSEEQYAQYEADKAIKKELMIFGDEIPIESIEVRNQSHYNQELLVRRINLDPESQPSSDEIEAGINRLYALDRFERITYKYEQREFENAIVVDVDEKDWGPNYLNFRFFLEDDFTTESQYGLGASVNFTDLGRQGAELRTSFELGTDKLVAADLYAPFFANQLLFNTLTLKYTDEGRNVSVNNASGNETEDLRETKDYIPLTYKEFSVDLGMGLQPALWNEVKVGMRYAYGNAEISFAPSQGSADYQRTGFYVRYLHDTLDSLALPTDGSLLRLEYMTSFDRVDASGNLQAEDESR
ncbi:outer membrane translocase [Vibrio ishigakensis]|uniref:Outer membrane translocase n=1 Tax=Vibrio ishigakensis TaxID=1481914 RepID=A0A0B8PF49_9VIBR|nr:outer membrane translocase [Vibrio ishigakensis]